MPRRIFLKPDGSVFQVGERLVQPDLGRTIRRLIEAGGDDFYTGEIAAMLAADFERHGGFITAEDLRDYPVLAEKPIRGHYRGLDIAATSVPSSGPQLVAVLQIMEHFDLAALGHNSAAYIDLFARATRAIYSDYVGMKGLSPEMPSRWSTRSSPTSRLLLGRPHPTGRPDRRPRRGGEPRHHPPDRCRRRPEHRLLHPLGWLHGLGVVVPGLGFLLNNFAGHLNPLPDQPDSIVAGQARRRIGADHRLQGWRVVHRHRARRAAAV